MSFYDELRTLSAAAEYQAAIDTIEQGILPIIDRQRLILQAIRAIAPPVPAGKERMKDCFWKQLIAFAPVAVVGSEPFKERKANWMREQRERAQAKGNQWPPRPLIRHSYFSASTYSLRFID